MTDSAYIGTAHIGNFEIGHIFTTVAESLGLADAVLADKALIISDTFSLSETVLADKTVNVADTLTIADTATKTGTPPASVKVIHISSINKDMQIKGEDA